MYGPNWQAYIVIAILLAICLGSALNFYRSRNQVSYMTRSPLTASLSMVFLGADTVTNTLIFSGINIGDTYHYQCDLGILATVLG